MDLQITRYPILFGCVEGEEAVGWVCCEVARCIDGERVADRFQMVYLYDKTWTQAMETNDLSDS